MNERLHVNERPSTGDEKKGSAVSGQDEDGPETLFGPVALVFGAAGLVAVCVSGAGGIAVPLLGGALGVTFGACGLVRRSRRGPSAAGPAAGSAALAGAALLIAGLGG